MTVAGPMCRLLRHHNSISLRGHGLSRLVEALNAWSEWISIPARRFLVSKECRRLQECPMQTAIYRQSRMDRAASRIAAPEYLPVDQLVKLSDEKLIEKC